MGGRRAASKHASLRGKARAWARWEGEGRGGGGKQEQRRAQSPASRPERTAPGRPGVGETGSEEARGGSRSHLGGKEAQPSPAREMGCGIQPALLPADFQHHVDSCLQSAGSVNCVTGTLTGLMLPFIHMCILNAVVQNSV